MAVLLLTNLVSFGSKCEVVTLCTWPPTKRNDCLRSTDHVLTGSVTQRSITLAYNGLHLPHSRTNTATSRKAEHEQRDKARFKSPCLRRTSGSVVPSSLCHRCRSWRLMLLNSEICLSDYPNLKNNSHEAWKRSLIRKKYFERTHTVMFRRQRLGTTPRTQTGRSFWRQTWSSFLWTVRKHHIRLLQRSAFVSTDKYCLVCQGSVFLKPLCSQQHHKEATSCKGRNG